MSDTNAVIEFYDNYDEDRRMELNPLEYLRTKERAGDHGLQQSFPRSGDEHILNNGQTKVNSL